MSGVQALVRVLLDQHRADAAQGLHTAVFVSGYQGSPLGGFDREVAGLKGIAAEHEIVHRPGVNEELGATAVWGSQLATTLPGARYDGVLGVWYGKAPGVDRSADAIRHGNWVGAHPRGGVLALCGDDPECKSSTLPSASESLLAALEVPVLAPGSVQELLDLGRHAISCSRASGLWAALKVPTAAADATATIEVGAGRVSPSMPLMEWNGAPYVHQPSGHLLAPQSLEMERTLREVRLELAKRYARENALNAVVADPPDAKLGIIAAGTGYQHLLQALSLLGLVGECRVLKVGLLYPLDEVAVRRFAAGLDEVLVLEEKGPFLERLVKDALYGGPATPVVLGERDRGGQRLVPATGGLTVDVVTAAVARTILRGREIASVRDRLAAVEAAKSRPVAEIRASRTPAFCSGCPHNASTKAPDDAIVGAGIGCHTMVMLNPAGRGRVTGITQMGGEGAQWIGAAPFLEPRHFIQNLGDGTLHHSGSLAIRAAVAAGINVTYKIFYNDAVAMTGGQAVAGQLSVPALARSLRAEGVRRIVITTEDPGRYRGVSLPAGVELRGRDAILRTQRELAEVEGVTALIHDQTCAAELRRARKRGKAPEPPQRVMINERVCEGCGDCGQKSGCLSVEPVETEFGRKTRIHQSSCNKDFSCLEGDCPSFMSVIAPEQREQELRLPDLELPEPVPCVRGGDVRIRLAGIGGTGVVTVSQVLGMAALLDSHYAAGLDQTGLSQKAGPVSSDIRISDSPVDGGASAATAGADVLLGLDIVTAASPRTLALAEPGRTVAIVSTSVVPTARMVLDVEAPIPDVGAATCAINAVTRASDNVFIDAQELSTVVFGDHMLANVIVLGAAWQRGAVPVTLESLRQALTLNGVQVEMNLAALEWGRACVARPEIVRATLNQGRPVPERTPDDLRLIDSITSDAGRLRDLLEIRVPDLRGWGGRRAAVHYVRELRRVQALELERLPGSTVVTEAVAIGLHKLIAYKDEYEVARLHLDELARLPAGSKVSFHLHPPLLRAVGLRHKLRFGRPAIAIFASLRAMRVLRGTPLDPFGHSEVRRVERRLPREYMELVETALERLDRASLQTAVAIAELPDLVRGYEQIKLAGVQGFRVAAAELLAQLPECSMGRRPNSSLIA